MKRILFLLSISFSIFSHNTPQEKHPKAVTFEPQTESKKHYRVINSSLVLATPFNTPAHSIYLINLLDMLIADLDRKEDLE